MSPRIRFHWPRPAQVGTGLAGLLLLAALVLPDRLDLLTLGELVRLPVEALVGAALVLALPVRVGRVVAPALGALAGLLALVKVLDMGFFETLNRPFDLVLDWTLLGDAVNFVARTTGRAGASLAGLVALVLTVAVPVLLACSARRLARLAVRRRGTAAGAVAVLGVVWVTCAALGVQLVPGVPVATSDTATLGYHRVLAVGAGLRDQRDFAALAGVDAWRDTPGSALLTGLRGKDVLLTFVESYGRVAIEDPQFAPSVRAVLDAGNRDLAAAGFGARSAFLTSPTFGGGSWLAHSTLLSGLWIDNQRRYASLLASDRMTLDTAFGRAGWRTVGVQPGITRAWPEGAFYGYDQLYSAQNLGYHGPPFNFASMPDQYTRAAFQRAERAPGHRPVLAELALLSSHSPWAPLPRPVAWDAVGDGTVFAGMPATGGTPGVDRDQIRTAYRQSIEYTLGVLISYVLTYGGDNLVLVFLGDHQPAPLVAGAGASHDVPVTIVAHDPAVLARIAGWGWQDGLAPDPTAPVWRMDAFRDRFLTAFGPAAGTPPPR